MFLYVERELYKTYIAGRILASIWREWRKWRAKVGQIFFWLLLPFRFCISFFVPRVDFRHWRMLRDSRRRQTRAGLQAAGRAGRRVWTLRVGKSCVSAGVIAYSYEFCAGHRTRNLAVFVVCWADRLWAANSLVWGLFHSLIPCRGSHGLKMTVRSQYCLFTFGHGFIISLFSML